MFDEPKHFGTLLRSLDPAPPQNGQIRRDSKVDIGQLVAGEAGAVRSYIYMSGHPDAHCVGGNVMGDGYCISFANGEVGEGKYVETGVQESGFRGRNKIPIMLHIPSVELTATLNIADEGLLVLVQADLVKRGYAPVNQA